MLLNTFKHCRQDSREETFNQSLFLSLGSEKQPGKGHVCGNFYKKRPGGGAQWKRDWIY